MDGVGVAYGLTLMVADGPGQPAVLTGVTVMVPEENTLGIFAVTGFAVGLLNVMPPVAVQL
jgi:hypothetical protein